MFTLTFSLDSVALYALSANLLALCTFVLVVYAAKKKRALAQTKIIDFVTEYFLNTGVEVLVSCSQDPISKQTHVQIESAPLKRFRFSNILESNLIGHIARITGEKSIKFIGAFRCRHKMTPCSPRKAAHWQKTIRICLKCAPPLPMATP